MIIANPIYDVAFKHLMDNERVARYFIETLIEEPVENIVVAPQEYTYLKKDDLQNEPNLTIERIKEQTLSLIRFDFVATIKTSDGGYKVSHRQTPYINSQRHSLSLRKPNLICMDKVLV